jgi:hypothetical protein
MCGLRIADLMPARFQARNRVFCGKVLAGEDENDVAGLVTLRIGVTERPRMRIPSDIDAELLIDPRSENVKRLVAHGAEHLTELCLSTLSGLPGDESGDSRHA